MDTLLPVSVDGVAPDPSNISQVQDYGDLSFDKTAVDNLEIQWLLLRWQDAPDDLCKETWLDMVTDTRAQPRPKKGLRDMRSAMDN
jgi:hypothetical protein